MTVGVLDVEQAYRRCEQITRHEAANFYYGIRLLPKRRRAALCAVYALARRIDDIGDGDLPAGEKLARLDQVRESLHRLPEEMRQARWMIKERQEFVAKTRREADELLDGAEGDQPEDLIAHALRTARR